jgi:hypothetical protein
MLAANLMEGLVLGLLTGGKDGIATPDIDRMRPGELVAEVLELNRRSAAARPPQCHRAFAASGDPTVRVSRRPGARGNERGGGIAESCFVGPAVHDGQCEHVGDIDEDKTSVAYRDVHVHTLRSQPSGNCDLP